jgi:uncharacterized protein (TIGR03435 family)
VKLLIQVAYGVEERQISGGPQWITTDRYAIAAKAPNADADKAAMILMLRSLLSERFGLQVVEEARTIEIYNLVIARKGPKLRSLREGKQSECNREHSFICGMTTVSGLAKALLPFAGRPVVDETGLTGKFDILLDFDVYSSRGQAPPADYDKPPLAGALEEQLGLRLERGTASVSALVVKGVQRPTAN